MHTHFLDCLMPVCAALIRASAAAGEIREITAYELMRAIGNLCIDAEHDDRYDARHMIGIFLSGLRPQP